jgi:tetratricopeptide (TPR) repeat protein
MGRKGGRGGGDGGGEPASDQYGETMTSQDRGNNFSGMGRGRGGGGGAGGGGRKGSDVSFIRHVPKFLQPHAHMLGQGGPREDDPEAILGQQALDDARRRQDQDEDDDEDDTEALLRAVEEDPSLAQQHPELSSVVQRAEAALLKERGNVAFGEGNYDVAVAHFGRAIGLDPQNEVYYSNRAAALIAIKRYSEAASDAKKAAEIKPRWAKAHARLGAALLGMEEYSGAREAYEAAARLEPDDRQVQAALSKSRALEVREEAEGRHRFKRKAEEVGGGKRERAQGAVNAKALAVKNKTLLSFEDGE